MRPIPDEFRQFYASGPGRRAAARLRQAIAAQLGATRTSRILALGHCAPILDGFDPGAVERLAVALPEQGEIDAFAPDGYNHALAVDELHLPFADALFDAALIIHALEHTAAPQRMLREIWRVLAPGGRMILAVPNRAGLWVHFETTPFGEGAPFGRRQLRRLLADGMFEIDHWQTLLAMPPVKMLQWIDRPMLRLIPGMGGLHLIRAVKCEGARPMMVGRASPARGRTSPARNL